MRSTRSRSPATVPAGPPGPPTEWVRRVAASRLEESLALLPSLLRRVRALLLVLAVSIPVFLTALVVILWRLVS